MGPWRSSRRCSLHNRALLNWQCWFSDMYICGTRITLKCIQGRSLATSNDHVY